MKEPLNRFGMQCSYRVAIAVGLYLRQYLQRLSEADGYITSSLTDCTVIKCCSDDHIEKNEVGGACSRGELYTCFGGETWGKEGTWRT
jgi:hypothetical protein